MPDTTQLPYKWTRCRSAAATLIADLSDLLLADLIQYYSANMRLILLATLATAAALPTRMQASRLIASNTPVREPTDRLSSWFLRLVFSKQENATHSPCFCAGGSLYCRDDSGELESKGMCGI
ncbi:hypothetical protein RB595_002064 [Gaeumannomyces hyphopodioides]